MESVIRPVLVYLVLLLLLRLTGKRTLAQITARFTCAELEAICAKADIPVRIARDIADIRADPHLAATDFFARSESLTVTPNEEIVDWSWATLEEALTLPLNSYTRTLVELARWEGR